MAKLTPEEFQEKHARRLKGATDDMRKGIERVTENPMLKAVAKQEKMRTKLMQSIDDGKWARGLKRVSTEEWKDKMINKGLGRVASGIDGAKDKVVSFASELLPHIDRLKEKVDKMPDTTIDDSANRMVAFMKGMSDFKRSK